MPKRLLVFVAVLVGGWLIVGGIILLLGAVMRDAALSAPRHPFG